MGWRRLGYWPGSKSLMRISGSVLILHNPPLTDAGGPVGLELHDQPKRLSLQGLGEVDLYPPIFRDGVRRLDGSPGAVLEGLHLQTREQAAFAATRVLEPIHAES